MAKRLLMTLFVMLLFAGCGSGSTATPTVTQSCTIVLSGAVSKTLPCTAGMAWDSSRNLAGVGIVSSGGANPPEAQFSFAVNGKLHTGTFAFGSAANASAIVFESTSQVWIASEQPVAGAGSLTMTSLNPLLTSASGTMYKGSGSANATLVAQGGASQGETMQINFTIDESWGGGTPAPQNVVSTIEALPGTVLQAPKIAMPGQAAPTLAATSAPGQTTTTATVTTTAGPSSAAAAASAPAQSGTTAPAPTPTTAPTSAPVPTQAPPPPRSSACQFTLSGAVNKTVSCTVRMVYSAKDGTTGFEAISSERISNVPEASLLVTISGDAAPGTYGWGESAVQAASVFEGGAQAFAAASKDGRGESSVTFSSLEVSSTGGDGGKVYAAHGSGHATLIGPLGTVTLEARF